MIPARHRFTTIVILFLVAFACSGFASGQLASPEVRPVFDERFDHWPTQLKINGRVLINRGMTKFDSVDRLLKRITADGKVAIFANENDPLAKHLNSISDENVVAGQFGVKEFKSSLQENELVYLGKTEVSSEQVLGSKAELQSYIDRGGNLILDSMHSSFAGKIDSSQADGKAGLNLFLDCLVDPNFEDSETFRQKFIDRVGTTDRTVGIGIEPDSMLLLSGRSMFAFGSGNVTVAIAGNDRPPEIQKLSEKRSAGSTTRIDLTQWRRMAIDQSMEPFPLKQPKTPLVENGTLYIVGGGGMPRGLMEEMIKQAGGKEKAKLVYVPCSEAEDVGERQRTVENWKRMGVKHATFIHTKDRNIANSDETFLEPLKDATMIWFGGGRQWNFADSYYGTKAHKLMKDVLHRGGVIGGSSAGASIQGRFLARATPIGNSNILAPGYERGGLGFLSGVAIDQHFSQRGRQKDMTKLVTKYPQLLGIGIDEATAIVVEKSTAKVIGRGDVYFYDRNQNLEESETDYIAISAGDVYDLSQRKQMSAATEED